MRQNTEAVAMIREARLGAPFVFTKGNHDVTGPGAAERMSTALHRFVTDHRGDLPADLSQLKPYFSPPFSDEVLNRYKLLHSGKLADLPKGEWLVAEIAPPMDDNERDGLVRVIRTNDYLRVRRGKY